MKKITIYGGKIGWKSNEGITAELIKETEKAYLFKTNKGDFWIPKSIFDKYYDYHGFSNKVVILPYNYKLIK